MNHNSPIRNDKLLREAYEAGRRDALNEQNLEVPAGGMQAVQMDPGTPGHQELLNKIRNDRNFQQGGGRAPYFPYDELGKKFNIGGMRWDGKRWVMYDRQGRVVLYFHRFGNPPGWYSPGGQPVWPNPNTTPSGTPGIQRIG